MSINALNSLGALVIGLGTESSASFSPREGLEAIATLTGAINSSPEVIDSGQDLRTGTISSGGKWHLPLHIAF